MISSKLISTPPVRSWRAAIPPKFIRHLSQAETLAEVIWHQANLRKTTTVALDPLWAEARRAAAGRLRRDMQNAVQWVLRERYGAEFVERPEGRYMRVDRQSVRIAKLCGKLEKRAGEFRSLSELWGTLDALIRGGNYFVDFQLYLWDAEQEQALPVVATAFSLDPTAHHYAAWATPVTPIEEKLEDTFLFQVTRQPADFIYIKDVTTSSLVSTHQREIWGKQYANLKDLHCGVIRDQSGRIIAIRLTTSWRRHGSDLSLGESGSFYQWDDAIARRAVDDQLHALDRLIGDLIIRQLQPAGGDFLRAQVESDTRIGDGVPAIHVNREERERFELRFGYLGRSASHFVDVWRAGSIRRPRQQSMIHQLVRIADQSWQGTMETSGDPYSWDALAAMLARAETLAISYQIQGHAVEPVGFSILTPVSLQGLDPYHTVEVNMVIPGLRQYGVGVQQVREMIRFAMEKAESGKAFRLVARHVNPKMIGAWARRLSDVFPNPQRPEHQELASPWQQDMGAKLAERVAPGFPLDAQKFVIRGYLANRRRVVYHPGSIPQDHDHRVNEFYTKRMEIRHHPPENPGHALLMTGTFDWRTYLRLGWQWLWEPGRSRRTHGVLTESAE